MEDYDHKLPFDINALVPPFSCHPHSGGVQLIFAVIVGLVASTVPLLGYLLLV